MERQNPSHRSQAVVDSEAAWRCLVPWLVFFLLIALAGTSRAANVSGVSASPNPFNASLPESTTISYTLANSALLWIRIYDNSSVLKRNLVTPGSYTATNKTAGANNSVWDGKDDSAVLQPDGTYPYRIDNVYFSAHYTGAGTNPQDVVVNPADTQIIWQLNKTSPYVFKSTNGGTNWSSVATTGADSKAYGIAIDSTGNKIYIANNGQSSLRKSTDGGTNWSASGTFPGSITSVYDVATDSTGNTVYVQDYSGNKVYKSTNGGTNWSTCTATGLSLGTTASGITTDSAGTTVIVADSGNNRFYRSTDSCATFSLIPNITAGTAAGQVSYPYQVSIQSDGSFWVSEQTNHRIQLFDSNGKSLMVVGGTSLGSGNYQFDSGAKYFGIGLATISSQPFIFIADYNNTRVKKLGYDNWSSTTHLQITSVDTTPPANPTGFTVNDPASSGTLNLSWTNPGDADFAGVKIVRATGASAPADCSGTAVYTGTGTSYNDTGLTNGTQYSYRICSYDEVPNYSTGATGSGTPTAAPAGLAMVVYGESTVTTPRYRQYTTASGFDASESSAQANVNTLNFTVLRESPAANQYHLANVHTDGKVYIQKYSSGAWASQWASGTGVNTGSTRHADIAYEQLSGEALAVYENSTGGNRTLAYRTYDGSSWSTEQSFDYSGLNGPSFNVVRWVKLVPRRNSNQILAMWMDSQGEVYAYIWNGSSFGNGKIVTTNFNNNNSTATYENFDGAWETVSGDALVFFPDGSAALRYAVFNGSTWTDDTAGPTLNANGFYGVWADSDPATDKIAVIVSDSGTKANFTIWDGSTWEGGAPAAISHTNAVGGMPVAVAWQETGGKALFVWGGTDAKVHYLTYTNGTGWTSEASTTTSWTSAPVKTVTVSRGLASGDKKIAVTAVDNGSDAKTIIWDDGAWSEPANFFYENTISANLKQPVAFAWNYTVTIDTTAPADPTGFAAANAGTGTQLNLSWTNPGDADFAGVKIVRATGASAPADCSGTAVYTGTGTSYNDTGLTAGTQYSYRICSYDTSANYSTGVTGSGTPTDTTAPAAVSNLTGPTATTTSVTLNWTAPGDNDTSGTATTYDVRYSTSNITNDTDFNNATQATGEPAPSIAGTAESFNVTGLTCATTYYFAVKTSDEVPNTSALSNVVSKATSACPTVTTGRVVYGDTATTGTPKTRVWDGTDFGAESSANNNTGANGIRYTVLKEAPTRTEHMLGNVHSDGKLYVQKYNGATWSFEGTFNSTNIGSGAYRYFDIAYEKTSGKALIAYEYSTTADRRIYYQTWNGTSWSAANTLDYSGLASSISGTVYWVKLVPKVNSDQILLIFSDSNGLVYSYIWNGTSFANGKTITINRGLSLNTQEVISGAWEGTSGDALVVFGNDNNGVSYATFNGTSWSSDATAYTFASFQLADFVSADGDPNSNYIGVITFDQQPKVEAHVWTGSAWESGAPTSATAPFVSTGMPVSVAWQNSGSKALFGWAASGTSKVNYVTYTVGAGWSSATLGSPSQTTTTWANNPLNLVQLIPDPTASSAKIMLTGVSPNSDIKSIQWDNGTWTQPTTYNYEAAVSSTAYGAVMFTWDESTADTTPPANPTGFTATNAQTGNTVNLAWTNPGDADFAGVKIMRATGATAPADCQSGTLVYDGPDVSYTDTSLTDGTQYSYRICAYDGVPNYSTGVTATATPTDTTAPANVTDVVATPGNTQVALSWTNAPDLDVAGTKILRKTGAYPSSCTDGTATTVYTGTGTSHSDTGLTNNTTYYYRLCSFDEVPNYPAGATVSATPYVDTTPPAEVSGFTVSNAGTGGKLNLSWSNPVDADFAGVKVVRATGSTAPANCSTGTVVYNSNGTDYLDTGLTNGQAYAYRACSYDTSGNYATGVTGSATPSDITAPANVTNLTATGASTQVSLSWTNPADSDFAGVKVLRRTDQTPASCTDGAATTVYNGVGTSHVDTGLTNGTTYYYLACSYDGVPNYPNGVSETGTPGDDTVAPSAVSNLSQNSTVYTRGASLTFTAPGDDADSGTAEVYDVRFTDAVDYPSNITSAYMNTNWATLTQAGGETAPQVAGSTELMTISADSGGAYMKPNTQYYFVMKTADDFGNVSGISNVISVHTALKYGYNLVSVPYKSSTGGANTVNDLMSDDVASVYIFTWESYGLDSGGYFNGDWVTVDPTTAITALSDGKGYYMYAYSMNSSVLDEKNGAESAVMTANSDNWAKMDLAQGRNIVGSPYLKNVDFTNVKICKASTFSTATGCSGGTVVSFSQAVTNAWMDGTIAYYGNSTTYTNETCNGVGCTAKLRPWWGQWVYLLLNDAAYIMAVPKP